MAIRLAAALSRITSLEKRNRELIQEIAALNKELAEVSKERHILSKKVRRDED